MATKPAKPSPTMVAALTLIATEQVVRINNPYDSGTQYRVDGWAGKKISAATINSLMARGLIRVEFLPAGFDPHWRFADRIYVITDAGRQALPSEAKEG